MRHRLLGAHVKCPYRAKIKPPLEVVVADLVITTSRTFDLIAGRCKEMREGNRNIRSIYEPYLVEKYSVVVCIGQEIL